MHEIKLQEPSGSFHSPNFPQKYPDSVTCTFIIKAMPHHYILLKFLTFETELSTRNLITDFVRVSAYYTITYAIIEFNKCKGMF